MLGSDLQQFGAQLGVRGEAAANDQGLRTVLLATAHRLLGEHRRDGIGQRRAHVVDGNLIAFRLLLFDPTRHGRLHAGETEIVRMLLPRLAVEGITRLAGKNLAVWLRALIEQIIKMSVFVFYVWAVSHMKDIKRVFMYHGAEHKTIFCFENELPLTVENVRRQSRFHPRCGTSFMILMILVGFLFSTAVQLIFKDVYTNRWFWVAVKILMVPFICGVGYELLKICGKYDNFITRIIAAPGLWLQRITTKEPEDSMIEIAIASVMEVLPAAEAEENEETKETE